MKILARLSDNVLEKEDWTVWELTVQDGKVTSTRAVENEATGAYGEPDFKGMTIAQLAEWTRYDGAGIHPEGYQELRISGRFKYFVNPDEIEQEIGCAF